MTQFIDLYLDGRVPGWPCYTSPRFSTKITAVASGDEKRNRNWLHPLRTFRLPQAVRTHDVFNAIQDHWLVAGGPEASFPFRDPLDFASVALECPNEVPDWSGSDQEFGTGDGFERFFQLTKTYEREGFTYTRPIYLPVDGQFTILMDGKDPSDVTVPGGPYTVSVTRHGGVAEFTPAPDAGVVLTWGGLFDVEVRFEGDDAFDGIVQSYGVSGFADLTLKELRSC